MTRAVRFDLVLDSRRYEQGGRVAERTNQRITESTHRAGSALKGVFATFSAGIVIAGLKKTVDAASSMNETVSKTKVVFGPAAKQVEDFSKRAATSMGLSRQEAMESAATFGNLFVSMKIGAPKAAEMSTKMIQLAGDLASFNNANPQETLEALRSGLVGETEPLRKFGINLNDADLRQKALAMGLTTSTKNVLPPAIKAQAAYALILEQSKTAQGDFARTSGGLANQQRILSAKIKDLQASIGTALLPTVLKGVTAFNSFLGVIDRNKTAFGVLFGMLATGAAVVGSLLLVERTVKATHEAIKVATVGWAAAQKGLNLILGTTALQAKATAEAEGGLAASTAAAGASSAGMRASMLTAVPVLGALAFGFIASRDAIKDNVSLFDELRSKLGFHVKAIDDAKAGTVAAAVANQKLAADAAAAGVSEGQLAGKTLEQGRAVVDTAAKTKEFGDKLAEARDELAQNRESMAQTIESYDGLISKSKVTAAEVVKDIHNQVANFKTYSSDVQRLIKAGVNPAAIRELSEKGPQYVHALAVGSNKRLGEYRQAWADRQAEIKGAFAKSVDAQYVKLKKTIENMQDKINELSGKTIYLTAKASVEINKSVKLYLQSIPNLKAFHAKGARIPGYGGGDIYPAMLEPGETVVSKEASKKPWMQEAFMAAGVPGYQLGGLASRYRNPVARKTWKIGRQMDDIAAGAIGMLAERGKAAMGGGAFTGGAASGNVIRLALGQAKRMAASFKVALALIEAGIVESGLRNLAYGDRDSLGFLQQRPSQGWKHPMNISYAAWDFLRRAIPIQGRYGTAGRLAQAVQRSAFPGRYDQQQARALGILHAYNYDHGGGLRPGLTLAMNNTGRTEPVGIDYDQLAAAMKRAGVGAVYLDGRRVDQALAGARISNAGRR